MKMGTTTVTENSATMTGDQSVEIGAALAAEMLDALRQWAWAEKNGDAQELENARFSRDDAIEQARRLFDGKIGT